MTPPDSRETLARAHQLFVAGDGAGAARLLEQHLRAAPGDVGALNLLAGVRHRSGDREGALAALDQAAQGAPNAAPILFNRANLLLELGRAEQAASGYDAALAARPDHAEGFLNRARALAQLAHHDEALADFARARALGAQEAAVLAGEALSLAALARHDEALAALDALLARAPADGDALYNRARCLYALERLDEAVSAYRAALQRGPASADLHNGLGVALLDGDHPRDALACFEAAQALRPHQPDAHGNAGLALLALGRAEEAAHAHARALACEPSASQAASIRYNMGMAKLAARAIPAGWDGFEARWDAGMINTPKRERGEPAWRGERVDGVLRLWPEQGIGDEVLFARLAPLAAQRAARVTLQCEPRLVPLFARSFPELDVCAVDAAAPPAAAQCAIGGLGAAMQVGVHDLGAGAAYLKADGARVRESRARYQRLAGGRPIVGTAWASKQPRRGAAKSAPIEDWRALLSRELCFINLQYGDVADDIARAKALFGADIHDDAEIDQMADLDAFAAQIAAMDRIVCISNTTVHLAGALGAPCIVLAPPARGLLWYWGVAGAATPWYASVTIVRRAPGAPRAGQIAAAAAMLA
jgi:tetratricopeptide (TPR) repeat protein